MVHPVAGCFSPPRVVTGSEVEPQQRRVAEDTQHGRPLVSNGLPAREAAIFSPTARRGMKYVYRHPVGCRYVSKVCSHLTGCQCLITTLRIKVPDRAAESLLGSASQQ